MEAQILSLLSTDVPMKTLDIAQQILGKMAKAKDVNPTLYKLQREGKVTKIAEEGGKNPRWVRNVFSGESFPNRQKSDLEETSSSSDMPSPDLSEDDLKQKILEILRRESEPVSTQRIAQMIFGKGATRKLVNPTLYSLKNQGMIKKFCDEDGTRPRWTLLEDV